MANPIKQGETVARITTIVGDVVEKQHVTYNKPTDSHYQLKWTFDFTSVSREELLRMASASFVIAMRPKFKTAPVAEIDQWVKVDFNVRDYLDAESAGQKLTPFERAMKNAEKLTPAQKKELAQKLQE